MSANRCLSFRECDEWRADQAARDRLLPCHKQILNISSSAGARISGSSYGLQGASVHVSLAAGHQSTMRNWRSLDGVVRVGQSPWQSMIPPPSIQVAALNIDRLDALRLVTVISPATMRHNGKPCWHSCHHNRHIYDVRPHMTCATEAPGRLRVADIPPTHNDEHRTSHPASGLRGRRRCIQTEIPGCSAEWSGRGRNKCFIALAWQWPREESCAAAARKT